MMDEKKQREIWLTIRRALIMIIKCIEKWYNVLDD
jgi:hypothetical protein